jgi:hypothetical protein
VTRFFIFQVFAIFLFNFFAGSALTQIQAIIADPTGTIVNMLGVAAAQQASFFMSYIMLKVSLRARAIACMHSSDSCNFSTC